LKKVKQQNSPQWAQDCLIQFISYERQRIAKRELSAGTLSNYYYAIKLFYEMSDIVSINWRRIAKGLPKARTAANDRAPTIEELQKLVEYPDRRIKPIVYIMCSGGIRIGAFENMKWKDIVPMPGGNGVAKL
jgi:integrase